MITKTHKLSDLSDNQLAEIANRFQALDFIFECYSKAMEDHMHDFNQDRENMKVSAFKTFVPVPPHRLGQRYMAHYVTGPQLEQYMVWSATQFVLYQAYDAWQRYALAGGPKEIYRDLIVQTAYYTHRVAWMPEVGVLNIAGLQFGRLPSDWPDWTPQEVKIMRNTETNELWLEVNWMNEAQSDLNARRERGES